MTILQGIETTAKKIEVAIEGVFEKEKPTIAAFFAPVIATVEQDGVDAAETAVAVGESTPGTGAAKMEAALASFIATFAAKAIPYVESEARMLIEVALQKLRALVTPPIVTAPATTVQAS